MSPGYGRVGSTGLRLPYSIRSPAVALFQRAQGLGERPLQPGEVVGLAVMVRRELIGPADRSMPDVVTDRSRPGKPDGSARLASVDRER